MPKVSYVRGLPGWGWIVGSGIYVDDVDALARTADIKIYGLTALVALILMLVTRFISRSIVEPIDEKVFLTLGSILAT